MSALPATFEPRQRWRIAYRRDEASSRVPQRDWLASWESGLARSGLPVLGTESEARRPRIAHAAPLPTGVAGERELADILLTARLPVADVRAALARALPPGDTLLDLHDVWLGAPPLPGRIRAARYRATVGGASRDEIAAGLARLLGATSLPRTRQRGSGPVRYDLRPLLVDARLADAGPATPIALELVLRIDPAIGTGRPADALAALAEPGLGGVEGLAVESIVRLGLILEDEPLD